MSRSSWIAAVAVTSVSLSCAPPPSPVEAPAPRQAAPRPVAVESENLGDFELGLRIAMEAYRQIGVVEDDSLNALVQDVGYRVASVVRSDAPFTFHVIDMPDPNAFALPGGFVFVTRGMLELGLTESELAALIGHEIGHVARNHFARSQRLSSVLSIAQLALTVGVLLAGDGGSPSYAPRYEVDDDVIYRGSTGRDAVVQGVPAFGGLFRTLVERKYGRGLEYEADEFGARAAVQSGYATDSAERMLRRFRRHIHDDQTYGYWLTHPFFPDRIDRAELFSRSLERPAEPPSAFQYRRRVRERLIAIASARGAEDDDSAAFIYHLALAAEPFGKSGLEAGHEILRFRTRRNDGKPLLTRELWPIVADYDSLITVSERIDAGGELTEKLRADRDSVEATRRGALSEYYDRLDRDVRATSLLERFVRNYPDSERLDEMRFNLAENYRRSGRSDLAAETYLKLIESSSDSVWAARAAGAMPSIVPRIESAIVMQELLDADVPDSLARPARARMDTLVTDVDTLEEASEFLERFPNSDHAPAMRNRLDEAAHAAFREARILEGVSRQQQALDAYHRILFLAPDSPTATEARARIDVLVGPG